MKKNYIGTVIPQQMVDGEFFAVFSELFSAVTRMSNKKIAVAISPDLLERAKAVNRKYFIGGSKLVQSEKILEVENIIRTFSPFQIEELTTYFNTCEIHNMGMIDSSGEVVVSFISNFDQKRELKRTLIKREPTL